MEQIDVAERLKTFMEFDCSTPASFAKMAGVDASNGSAISTAVM